MGIETYTLEQSNQWDKIVRSFELYDTYWLSGYVKAFWLHGDGEPMLFYYKDEFSRGISVVMKRDVATDPHFINKIKKAEYFDFATPYGYGGWIIEGDSHNLFNEYARWCTENGIISEFVRFHPVIKNHQLCALSYDIVQLGPVITMDITNQETIWSNLTSKNRNMIRKAQKNGVKIYSARNPEIFHEFKKIYDGTMDKDHADRYYYFHDNFYRSILDDLPYNARVFYAEYEEKIIAASVMLYSNRMMNYHLSGSVKDYSGLAPTNLILFEAALWGSANGYKTLYLGGGVGSGEDNLYKFKKAFNRRDDDRFFIGKKIYDEEKYKELTNLRGNIESGYFPKYRA